MFPHDYMTNWPIYPTNGCCTNDKVYSYLNEQLAAGERTGANRILNDEADEFIPKKVIFNSPATIVYWSDGSKTVVKCKEGEEFDREKGLAMAISKKVLGKAYRKTFKEAEI